MSQPSGPKESRPATRRRSSAGSKQLSPRAGLGVPRARDGSVGRQTVQAVEGLLRQGTTKTEAFQVITAEMGRSSGAVAANYYRVIRTSGRTGQRKSRIDAVRPTPTPSGSNAPRSVGRPSSKSHNDRESVDQSLATLVASLVALTDAVRAQDAERKELRNRLDSARRRLR